MNRKISTATLVAGVITILLGMWLFPLVFKYIIYNVLS